MNDQRTGIWQSNRIRIAVAFMAFILIGGSDATLGVLLPGMQKYYQINKATISIAFLAGTGGYFMASLSSGLLVERLGKRGFLMLGALAFLLGTVTLSLAPAFPLLLGGYVLLGMGVAIIDAGLNTYIAGLPGSSATLNYLHAFYGAGALIGPLVATSFIALQLSWNQVYLVWSSFCLLILLSVALVFRDQQPALDTTTAEVEKGAIFSRILRMRIVWLAAFFLLFYVGSEISLGNWSYSFLTQYRQIFPLFAGWMVSGYWLGLMLGRVVLGFAARRIGEPRLILGCLVGVVIGTSLLWVAWNPWVSAFALMVTGFALGPLFPTAIALLPRYISPRLLPGAVGFLISLGSMGGALWPWLMGNLAQTIGLWTLVPFVLLLTCAMLGFWLAVLRVPASQKPLAA